MYEILFFLPLFPLRSAVEELCLFLDLAVCQRKSSGMLWKSVGLPTPSHYFQGAHGSQAREQHIFIFFPKPDHKLFLEATEGTSTFYGRLNTKLYNLGCF